MSADSIHAGWVLFRADLRAQYRDSMLGVFWIAIPILITGFAFLFLKRIGVVKFESHSMQYASYAFTGITLWQIFLSGANNPVRYLSGSKRFLQNSQLTILTVYFQALFHSLFELLFKYAALGAILWFLGDFQFGFVFPGIIMVCVVMGVGMCIGMLVAPIACIFSDVSRLFDACLMILFFITPIFHNGSKNQVLQNLIELNPLYYVMHSVRTMLVRAELNHFFLFFMITIAFSMIGCVGFWMSNRLRSFIVERM